MLKDALLRGLNVAEMAGIRAVLLHALSDRAKVFYLRHGFVESPVDRTDLSRPASALDSTGVITAQLNDGASVG